MPARIVVIGETSYRRIGRLPCTAVPVHRSHSSFAIRHSTMLRLGFIGSGAIAEVHAEAAQRAGSQIIGFFDVDEQRARAVADKFGVTLATSSLSNLLACDCEAVIVAVPNHLHKEM